MEFKAGWTYVYSDLLKQYIALHNKTQWAFCEDGTKYSPRELAVLYKTYGSKQIPLEVHTLKKVFGGEIQDNVAMQGENQPPTKQPPASSETAANKYVRNEVQNELDIF